MNLLSYHPPHFTNRTFFIPSSFNNPNSFLYNGHAFYSDPNHYRFFRNEQRFPRPLFIKPQPCLKMNMCRYRAACLYLPYCAFSHSEEEREFYQLCSTKLSMCDDPNGCSILPSAACNFSHSECEIERYGKLVSTHYFTEGKLQLCRDMEHRHCYHDPCLYSHSEEEFRFALLCYSKHHNWITNNEDIFYASKFQFTRFNWYIWFLSYYLYFAIKFHPIQFMG